MAASEATSRDAVRILVVDDDPLFKALARRLLRRYDYEPVEASNSAEAIRLLDSHRPQVVLLDHRLGDEDGRVVLPRLRAHAPNVPVILVTGNNSVDVAVECIKLGAFDFLTKPLDEPRFVASVAKACEHHRLLERVRQWEAGNGDESGFEDLIGTSPQMKTIYRIIENVAPTDATVMIVGESGTGKELVARAIFRRSRRSRTPFVALNMAAVPHELLESTLYGHEKGAFTGADRRKIGAAEEAEGGTLFLDEICEMPLALQPKLLRFIQERRFRRVGGSEDIDADVRIISATNRTPLGEVRQGRLREDLYYRLNVVPIHLPPLRERREDIPLLAMHALGTFARAHRRRFRTIEEPALRRLTAASWPGNVRQLFHTIERTVVLNDDEALRTAMLPDDLDATTDVAASPPAPSIMTRPPRPSGSKAPAAPSSEVMPLAEIERRAIIDALAVCGSPAKAADALGISEATIYRRIRSYRLGADAGR